ncbi:MAG: hypothetical protein U1C47_18050 [Hydrogenophaga sp.]|uniref:hypothetical protein n=1 Tax=Hydrogenophaga sp. TaxID=1904254 RepID=UPI0027349022|nr:hypothetical protein [Hydrogenophaga sp.]MDP3626132.1 hypothetical protein [Hydrogenophaga sp.]MDZ4293814.1 hypothetical protein [Hydrogenophaga sp.]
MSTFSRVNTNTVEIWIDEVLLEGFQPSALRDGKWVPSFLNDGTPDLVDIVKTDRDGANRWRIDCARQRFAFMSVVKYGANGTVTESREKSGALSEADWSLVVPDSVGEMVLLAACKL